MSLAAMIVTDEDALICDFAETYHVLDYRALPIKTAAVLASGLRENSRIKMKIAGARYVPPEIVLPKMADELTLFRYGFTKESETGKNYPPLFTEEMYSRPDKDEGGFLSGEDFFEARSRILKEMTDG